MPLNPTIPTPKATHPEIKNCFWRVVVMLLPLFTAGAVPAPENSRLIRRGHRIGAQPYAIGHPPFLFVTPAKAGVQPFPSMKLDSRLRGNDEGMAVRFVRPLPRLSGGA